MWPRCRGATASFLPALLVGIAYVFGMVAPLAVLALVWDRRDWGSSRLLIGRQVAVGVGRFRRTVPLASVLSGGLLVAMGALTIVLAIRGPSMPTNGWQVRFTAWLDHQAATVERALSALPPWLPAFVIFAALALLVVYAVRGSRLSRRTTSGARSSGDTVENDLVDDSCCAPSFLQQPTNQQSTEEQSMKKEHS